MIVFEIPDTAIRWVGLEYFVLSRSIVLKRRGKFFTLRGTPMTFHAVTIPEPYEKEIWVIKLEQDTDCFEFFGSLWEIRQHPENASRAVIARVDWPVPKRNR